MKLNTRNFIALLLVGVGTIYLYYGLRSEDATTKINTQKPTVSAEMVETDTGKRLETIAQSGTSWGMSPFGSGKPLEETPVDKPKFQKPNTEWKTRTLNINGRWITYEFGKGNPAGATPLSEEEIEAYKKCYYNTVVHAMDCPPPPGTVAVTTGYFNSETEKDLLILLNSPLWKPILTNCEQQFRSSEISVLDHEANYNRIISGEYLSIENLIVIDDRDGRKMLSNNFGSTMFWFGRALRENKEVLGTDILKLNNCITQNGGLELYRLMDTLYQKQFYIG